MARQAPSNDQSGLKQIQMSTRELTTQQQVSTLLNIAGMMWSAMQGPPASPFEPEAKKPEKTEGWIAAENCFIKTCAAIERIVDDAQRFDFSFQKKMEDDYAAAMQMNLEYIKAHRDIAVEHASPHAICNPTLVKLADGSYMAVLGNPNSPNDSIAGAGRSPQEALEAFDLAFKGLTEKIKNEKPKVDSPAAAETPEPPKRKRIYPRNKPTDGTDGKVG